MNKALLRISHKVRYPESADVRRKIKMWDKWAERIYSETDLGRSIATTCAGIIGLFLYLLTSDIAIAGFSALILFPVIRVIASKAHNKTELLEKLKEQEDGLQKLYDRLSPEEKKVVSVFVGAGGSVMTWGQINKSETQFSAIESLIQRGLLHTSATADGCRETFVLDQDIFDMGQKHYEPPL